MSIAPPSSRFPLTLQTVRIALVHDWLVTWRGGEQVLGALAAFMPQADLFALVADPTRLPPELRGRRLTTSWLQAWPIRRRFRWGLPLMPWTIEQFRFDGYDLVISVSHAVAKGVRTGRVPHLSYCLTPMRYAWGDAERYFGPRVRRQESWQHGLVEYLRHWDIASAGRVTTFAAISRTVQQRIRACYDRAATIIHPPVDCARFERVPRDPQPYALVVSALVPYKRVDVAIEAFNHLRRPLVIIGEGPEAARLRHLAGPTITFKGWQTAEALAQWYAGARALIYPQEEDFGLAAVEAQAAGCPVVAYRRGGAIETVREGITGFLFEPQTVEALADAVQRLDRWQPDPAVLRQHARQFDHPRFERAFTSAVAAVLR